MFAIVFVIENGDLERTSKVPITKLFLKKFLVCYFTQMGCEFLTNVKVVEAQ